MKKFMLLGLVALLLAGCDDMPLRGFGGDDLIETSHQKNLVSTSHQQAQSSRPDLASRS
jgi:outer membrane biogenesis lipoprotein LolB